MELLKFIAIISGFLILLFLIGSPAKLFKLLGHGAVKLLIGALLLFFLNVFGHRFGIYIPINLMTSAVAGLLGIPGLCALVVIETWIV